MMLFGKLCVFSTPFRKGELEQTDAEPLDRDSIYSEI